MITLYEFEKDKKILEENAYEFSYEWRKSELIAGFVKDNKAYMAYLSYAEVLDAFIDWVNKNKGGKLPENK